MPVSTTPLPTEPHKTDVSVGAIHESPAAVHPTAQKGTYRLVGQVFNAYLIVEIGERIMAKLRELDDVAYIRFCSVYREFNEADAFINELNNLKKLKESRADGEAK